MSDPDYKEVWYPAFKKWFSGIYGEDLWKDRAIIREDFEKMKKSFRAGWRAAVNEAKRRVAADGAESFKKIIADRTLIK